jgi:hypothetical protein
MKNLLSVLAVSCVMLFGMSSITAQDLSQDQDRPEVIAKTKVADLSPKLSLNGDQQRSLFRAYTAYESNFKKHVAGKPISDPKVQADKRKFDEVLKAAVKESLTADQYKKWLTLQQM